MEGVISLAVFEKLSMINDIRKEDNSCEFNGYLEDYLLEKPEDVNNGLFSKLLSLNQKLKVCTNLGFNVNTEVISNQIIRYKDSLKLPEKAIKCPYIIYTKIDEIEKGIILTTGSDYLLAKGFYYCLTEQYALLQESRNELIVMCMDNPQLVLEKVEKFLKPDSRAGGVQREIDNYYFRNVNELAELAVAKGQEIVDNAKVDLLELEDRADYIYGCVSKWYLLKKAVYVSYMTNKDILAKEHEGDIKKQRYQAKALSDKIPFIVFSEMWRMKKEETVE